MDFYSVSQYDCNFSSHLGLGRESVVTVKSNYTNEKKVESRLDENTEKYNTLQQQHASLKDQHEKLKKHFASLSETVQVLGDQSSQTTRVAQRAQDSKLELINKHLKVESTLQEQLQHARDLNTKLNLELTNSQTKLQEQLQHVHALKFDSTSKPTVKLQEQLQQANDLKLDLINRHTKLQEQLQQAHESRVDLLRRHSDLQGQLQRMKDTMAAQTLQVSCNGETGKTGNIGTGHSNDSTHAIGGNFNTHNTETVNHKDLIKRNSELQGQLNAMKDMVEALNLSCTEACDSKAALAKRYSDLQGQFNGMKETVNALNLSCKEAHDTKTALMKQYNGMKETVDALNLSCKEAHDAKTTLAKQYNGMKETVEALNLQLSLSCKAHEDKLLLQSQLHSDKLRLLEVTHNTLRDRCKTIAVSAEQHRIANISLEERHKSLTRDIEILANGQVNGVSSKDREISQLQLLLSSKTRDICHLQSLVSTKDSDISHLQSQVTGKERDIIDLKSLISSNETNMRTLKKSLKDEMGAAKLAEGYTEKIEDKEREISSLKSKINSHENEIHKFAEEYSERLHNKEREISSLRSKTESRNSEFESEIKRLQGRLDISQSLLKSHPVDHCLYTKTKNIIQSSAEILELAHDTGSSESMRQCLGQVGDALQDLSEQLDTQHRISSVWLDQVRRI
jgi:chromosome segregation ATPase